jgi:hypothetical protein
LSSLVALFAGTLFVLALGTFGLLFLMRLRMLQAAETNQAQTVLPGRYRPMLRLLADEDFRFVSANPRLKKTLRAERCRLFRGYLRCLTRDYGRLLAGLRHAMVHSGVDRPDLAQALVRNRFRFAVALCNAEMRLVLYSAGIGKVDISGLVGALDALRTQAGALPLTSAAAAAH